MSLSFRILFRSQPPPHMACNTSFHEFAQSLLLKMSLSSQRWRSKLSCNVSISSFKVRLNACLCRQLAGCTSAVHLRHLSAC